MGDDVVEEAAIQHRSWKIHLGAPLEYFLPKPCSAPKNTNITTSQDKGRICRLGQMVPNFFDVLPFKQATVDFDFYNRALCKLAINFFDQTFRNS